MSNELETLRAANSQLGQAIVDRDAQISGLKDQITDANNREMELRTAIAKLNTNMSAANGIVQRQAQEIAALKDAANENPAPKKPRKVKGK